MKMTCNHSRTFSTWDVKYRFMNPVTDVNELIAGIQFGKLAAAIARVTFRVRIVRSVKCGCGIVVNEPERIR